MAKPELGCPTTTAGENGSRYFKNRTPFRKLQGKGNRLASFGGQIKRKFPAKIQFLVVFVGFAGK